jgi:hypothetical protein
MTKFPMTRSLLIVSLTGLSMVLAACSEKPQTLSRKADSKAWEATAGGYNAAGFKGGDQAAWEEQMRRRALGQNEYARAVAAP